MAQSFKTSKNASVVQPSQQRRKVLVTGAGGNIGSYFAEKSCKKYDLRLMIHHSEPHHREKLSQWGEVVNGDVCVLEEMKQVCAGVDTIIHMAGDPSPNSTWESLHQPNIVGVYNVFVAAKSAGVRRVIYASSIHAVSGYAADVQVKTTDPVNPGDLYGVTKCFGEAMARYMAEQEGLSAIAIRIGAFQPIEAAADAGSIGMLDAFISRRDMNQLLQKAIDVEGLDFAILHGLSDNRFKRMDISDTRELIGYEPQDDLTELNPRLKELHLRDKVDAQSQADARQQSGIREDVAPAAAIKK